MQTQINRLISCGFSPHEAYRTYYDFLKEFSLKEFEIFILSIEKETKTHVDRIQSESDGKKSR